MKTKHFYTTLSILFFFSELFSQKTNLPDGIDKDWYTAQTIALQKVQYTFKPAANNSFQAYNKNLLISVDDDGYSLQPADKK